MNLYSETRSMTAAPLPHASGDEPITAVEAYHTNAEPHASGAEPVIGNRVIDDNSSAPREWG